MFGYLVTTCFWTAGLLSNGQDFSIGRQVILGWSLLSSRCLSCQHQKVKNPSGENLDFLWEIACVWGLIIHWRRSVAFRVLFQGSHLKNCMLNTKANRPGKGSVWCRVGIIFVLCWSDVGNRCKQSKNWPRPVFLAKKTRRLQQIEIPWEITFFELLLFRFRL